ncbi:MAG: lipopolysaccharide biosynthesis protein [Faecousia sp.]
MLTLSQQYLGINSTLSGLISTMSVAELGIGSAITFSLYKPIAEKDHEKIAALSRLYRKVYFAVGTVIGGTGLCLMPFLPGIFPEIAGIPHWSAIFLLFLLDSVLSYYLGYKQVLIIANQKQYIVTGIRSRILLACSAAQMVCLLCTGSYIGYLLIKLCSNLAINLILANRADRMYPFVKAFRRAELDRDAKQEILKNAKAMIGHRLGGTVVFGTDNLLLAYFCGVTQVGIYSNYLMVTNGLRALFDPVFTSLSSSVGNLGAAEDQKALRTVFERLDFAGSWLYYFSAICLYVLYQPFISLWVGEEYLFSRGIVFLIVTNFYVTGMRNALTTFRESLGLFWYDRYKPFWESGVNLAASIVLARYFGIAGIFIGTLLSTMCVCFPVEPYVVYRYGLDAPVRSYYLSYARNTLLTFFSGWAVSFVSSRIPLEGLPAFAANILLCLILPNVIFLLAHWKNASLRYYFSMAAERLGRKRR